MLISGREVLPAGEEQPDQSPGGAGGTGGGAMTDSFLVISHSCEAPDWLEPRLSCNRIRHENCSSSTLLSIMALK